MDEFFKMDVFFFITSVAVVAVSIFLSIVLYRVYRILGTIEHLTKQVSQEADAIRLDISNARTVIKREGLKIKHAMAFFTRFTARRKAKSDPSK